MGDSYRRLLGWSLRRRPLIVGVAVALVAMTFATLPLNIIGQEYALEYGVDTIEIHADAIGKGDRVLLIDDLIATGGTADAAIELIRKSGGDLIAAAFVIDLPDLGGSERLRKKNVKVHTLVNFAGH